jgi:hypothetical protein
MRSERRHLATRETLCRASAIKPARSPRHYHATGQIRLGSPILTPSQLVGQVPLGGMRLRSSIARPWRSGNNTDARMFILMSCSRSFGLAVARMRSLMTAALKMTVSN